MKIYKTQFKNAELLLTAEANMLKSIEGEVGQDEARKKAHEWLKKNWESGKSALEKVRAAFQKTTDPIVRVEFDEEEEDVIPQYFVNELSPSQRKKIQTYA